MADLGSDHTSATPAESPLSSCGAPSGSYTDGLVHISKISNERIDNPEDGGPTGGRRGATGPGADHVCDERNPLQLVVLDWDGRSSEDLPEKEQVATKAMRCLGYQSYGVLVGNGMERN